MRILVILTMLSFPGWGRAEGRQQVWAVRLPALKEPPGWTEFEHHDTRALAFSPDGKRLALTLAHNGRVSAHVLIIEVNSPETNVRQFDFTQTCGVDPTWNQRSDAILVCGAILQLVDGATCRVGSAGYYPGLPNEFNRSYWLDSDHVVRWDGAIFDLTCRQAGTWRLEPAWRISAAAPSKGWVLLSHSEDSNQQVFCRYSIVDRASQQSLSGWPTSKPQCGANMMLAAGAAALCFNLDGRQHCLTADGAREIPIPKPVRSYVLNQAASSSARVVAEKWEADHFSWWEMLLFWWVPYPGFPALPRQATAFDLRSGTIVSSWKSRIQDSRSPYIQDWPYHLALSARGELLAESGDGVLELYRLAP